MTLTPHQQLMSRVADLEDAGTTIPCRDRRMFGLWTSDDRHEQEAAAHRCAPCPVFAMCRAYGIAHPDEIGVYAALTQADRRTAARTNGTAA